LLSKYPAMRIKLLPVFVLMMLLWHSCVPNKELVYLQENEEKEVPVTDKVIEMRRPYRVQVNDILYVDLKASDPELVAVFSTGGDQNILFNNPGALYFQGYAVDVHGNIRLPVLGEVNVLGYTADEIRKIIEEKLITGYLTESANLFVNVKLAGLNYSVLGEVTNPGANVLFQERVNVLEAIAGVGDITITGNRKDVLIIRQYPDGKKIHHLDLTDKDILKSPYFNILPNDIIYVKPLKQKSWGVGTTGTQTLTTVLSIVSIITSTVLLIRNL